MDTWILVAIAASSAFLGLAVWPGGGLLKWMTRLRATRRRILAEDALKHIHGQEWDGYRATHDSLAGALRRPDGQIVQLIARMEAQGLVLSTAEGLSLTPDGERLALQVIRAHRLWERYLADEARMSLADIHREAERREHDLGKEWLDALEAAMGHPLTDPHGDPIPTADGELARIPTQSIAGWAIKKPARIVHLEDEPPTIFAQIAALGLYPGQVVWVLEKGARRFVLSDGSETHVIAPVVAGNIFVTSVEGPEAVSPPSRLTVLRPGQSAVVCGLDEALQGFTRRRLLDLGLTSGAKIAAEMSSMTRDPTAYRVRGSLVALRKDQAKHVLIKPDGNGGRDDS